MKAFKATDVKGVEVTQFPYKGIMREVKGVTVRWLSKAGQDENGQPEYGLRLFTVEPGGKIPTHSHFYLQTMYIVSGTFDCFTCDPDTDQIVESRTCGPGDSVYVDSHEPHGMSNIGQDAGTFLCCICNVYEDGKTI